MAFSGESVESLEEIPAHVWSGLPEYLNLGPSAVNPSRIGVWATTVIPKGKRFGPFIGEKKKRSQVPSNVYMWEVYFPARGWMCIDATDPLKGNWLRYVNWARSSEEQNLFPLEINRAIYYKVLRPIGPGEELLVWYTVEDNPEITAALEEERASRRSSPRSKRARRKLVEKARQAGLGGFKKTSGTKTTAREMWEGGEGDKEEGERPSGTSQELHEAHPLGSTNHKHLQDTSASGVDKGNYEEDEEEEDEEEENGDDSCEMQHQTSKLLSEQSSSLLSGSGESHKDPQESPPLPRRGGDPEQDPDGELEEDLQGESYPCDHCERHFSSRQGLERHIHVHGISNQQAQVFKCRYCNKPFSSQVGRRRHERRHENGSKKMPGSQAGVGGLLSPAGQTDSSPDCTSPTSQLIAIGSQFDMQRKELGLHTNRPSMFDENGESKELHPCKYCNKAFGTHTNMRRHQRRIHERHLLPKGVRRKGMLLQEASAQQPGASPSASPPLVYMPSADTEDEADRDDYAIDISKNISENLSFYIDGKIVSTSTASSCEVIEVDTRSAALFGLDTVIISPNQISQALKVEARTNATKPITSNEQPAAKRRTSTPPLVTSLKVETETAPSPSSSTSSSSNLLVGGLFQQDSSTLQREKTIYLSPKLKQLLQTQDFQKSTIALITESHRLAALPGASGKFKRRTGSPPSSPQLSPTVKTESCKAEAASENALKVPKLESHSVPPPESLLDEEDEDSPSSSGSHASSSGGGSSCNQQPLDLSSSVCKRSDGPNQATGDSALDLSVNRKAAPEPDLKGGPAPQPPVKKKKPNTSMLEKVLMNEYVGLTLPGEEGPSTLATLSCFRTQSPNVASDSAHPSPPSLTPVTINPSSPSSSSVTSPTPPPPILPTIPSPPTLPSSPQPSDSPLPVLSPKMSPKADEPKHLSDSIENFSSEENKDEEESNISEPQDYPSTPLQSPPNQSVASSPLGPKTEDLAKNVDVSLSAVCNSLTNGSLTQVEETEISLKTDFAALSPQPELPSSSKSPPVASHRSSPSAALQSPPQIKVKEEPLHCEDDLSAVNHSPHDSSLPPAALDKLSTETREAEEVDSTYCKTFVCNVCEEPFDSIKELSGHITDHAADWPFKCEFCVQLFGDEAAVLAHRTALHGVGRIFLCSVCSKEFAFLCNLQQHQKDLHPNESCTHTTVESGKLRPQNYTDPSRAKEESAPSTPVPGTPNKNDVSAKEEADVNGNNTEDPNEELYTTIKIMASEGGKPKGPDVRLGINQHYPSFKPPPFPYHSRSHSGSVASATNFTTHNIPQTFSTAIRCTKCGNSFDNMPELHKHILVCANASDKKRYTPKKNPIPLKQIVKSPNGMVSPTTTAETAPEAAAVAGQSAFRRMGQPKKLNFNQETGKMKMSALSKKKNQLVQKAISQKHRTVSTAKKVVVKSEDVPLSNVCPHCSREFTYTASLHKHMVISCPMKPAVTKKGKKGLAEVKKEAVSLVDKNTNRKRLPEDDVQTEPRAKPPGKRRARSLTAAEPESTEVSKGKPPSAVGRLKRPAVLSAPIPARKKTKKGQAAALRPPSPPPDTPSDTAQRPTMRMKRTGKKPATKRSAVVKPPPAALPAQLKKEERVSLRKRDRAGGPVTRSSQMANSAPPAEVKTEEQPLHETKDPQELPMK
ncbi:PREDICTED: PR domain zinc finger protein 2-like [Poecilia mexicana]|uniref:PR domain containing 2, with ZNF domain b n=1 Tax=Poecilia mexicana TaxID=48701 RepID=A0A3B3XNT9_9TELE|nr:PREDICTED: PR domain zinc finger protein 2-like [Poecilia mexicana]